MNERIELLDPRLLDEHRAVVADIKRLSRQLGVGLGWHYLLDLAWILRETPVQTGMTVLDAGAGTGILQWYLADRGVNVLSVDLINRSSLPVRFRVRYPVVPLRRGDLKPMGTSARSELLSPRGILRLPQTVRAVTGRFTARGPLPRGKITLHRADLTDLEAVPDASVDHVVAVSALEHNAPERLPTVLAELRRVLRPGGVLAATVGASPDRDWFHEPSRGWCYTDGTLRRLFSIGPDAPSNYERYAEILSAIRACSELRDSLASFYFRSGDNGMPWGKWDPKYLSVGVRSAKPA